MEIIPGIYSLPASTCAFMGTFPPNVYLVVDGKAALIDSGYGHDDDVCSRLGAVQSLGASLSHVIITHAHVDHMSGARQIATVTGATILVHRLDAPAAARALGPDAFQTMEDGERVALGSEDIEVIHTPGHSPGQVCLYHRQKRVLFSGDHILGRGTTVVMPPLGDMTKYIDSLRRLLNYDIDLICPGHGPVVHEPRRKIEELIAHRLERERQILSCLVHGKRNVEELVEELYSELDPRLHAAAAGQMRSHLTKLLQEEKVIRREVSGREEFFVK